MAHPGQTLENPASGERITFRKTSAATRGELLAVDLELPAGRRVPGGQHIHPKQEERFEVVEGTMRFRMGRKRVVVPGEVVGPPPLARGTTSRMWATVTHSSASRCARH